MLISDYRENFKLISIVPSFILPRLKYYYEKSFEICFMKFVYDFMLILCLLFLILLVFIN